MTRTPEEFAAQEQQAIKCRTCTHPLRDQLDAAFANGLNPAVLARWMKADHPDIAIREGTLREHFRSGHHVVS